jgi:hypothetical protein
VPGTFWAKHVIGHPQQPVDRRWVDVEQGADEASALGTGILGILLIHAVDANE